ncbi:hypothetical protein D9619_013636 [Psilocybe cf. subviscida]|uniref:DUF6533 domain-containing protein n=1 Tax=Psilocybe cf. subviscida TaxID=2480587 RepID=A0A8H5F949_9AGAR|nr:hypothetical protein D9619_013636 [Psilocybe cf. subviscida]
MASQDAALISTIELFKKQNYSLVASMTFLVYDILSTFPDEVQYIWSREKWSLTKVLYILIRYYGIVYLSIEIYINLRYNVPLHVCKGYFWYWNLFGGIMFTTVANMIFSLRTYALYGNNKRVLVFLLGLCFGGLALEFYASFLSARDSAQTAFLPPPGVPLTGCLTLGPPLRTTLYAWVPDLVINSSFFVASLIRLATWSDDHGLLVSRNRGPGVAILKIFLRDGVLFYLLTMAVVVVNTATSLTDNGRWNVLTFTWKIVAYSFSGAHIILNLRTAGSKRGMGIGATTTATQDPDLDSMRFAHSNDSDYPRVPH